jgi:hypothetical protein
MSARDVEEALASLERAAREGRRPGHHLARHLLLGLGAALREQPERCAAWIERAQAAGTAAGAAWKDAVLDELTLACGEFAQCVDPRYLDLPDYDHEYTRGARARLEDRLRCARELGFTPTPRETEIVELADCVLEAATRRKAEAGGQRGRPSPAEGGRSGPDGAAGKRSTN